MPAFKPVPSALAERYLACLPDDTRVERRRMFGCPCAFVNGNMFSGLHEDRLVLRLPAVERERVLAAGQALAFEVMGRTMREYVVLPAPLDLPPTEVSRWIARAFDYGASLPAKEKRAKRNKGAKRKSALGASAATPRKPPAPRSPSARKRP